MVQLKVIKELMFLKRIYKDYKAGYALWRRRISHLYNLMQKEHLALVVYHSSGGLSIIALQRD
jgi:hypothetical protein